MDSIVSVTAGPSRQAKLGVSSQISYTVVGQSPPKALGRIRDAFHNYDQQGPLVGEGLTREHAGR